MTHESPTVLFLINTTSNAGEIAGIFGGGRFVIGTSVLWANKYGNIRNWLMIGATGLIGGLALPGIAFYVARLNPVAGLIVGLAICIPLLVMAYKALFAPWHIASLRNKNEGWAFALSLLSIVLAPVWLIGLYLATKADKKVPLGSTASEPPVRQD